MSDHATLSPSGSKRWMQCPGSVQAEEGLPDNSSVFAEEGTRAHALCHYMLDPVNAEYAEPDDADMERYSQQYVDYVESIAGTKWYEVKVQTGITDCYGTADAIIYDNVLNNLHVIDFKYGKGQEVSVIDNPQLLLYAWGAVLGLEFMYDDIKTITLHIHQPRMNNISVWEITIDQLMNFAEAAYESALATTADDAPLKAGTHCHYCKAKPTCRAAAERNMAVAKIEFSDLTISNALPAVGNLSVNECAYILGRKKEVMGFFTSIEQHLTQELKHGRDVPDWKLVAGRSSRTWRDPVEAEQALRKVSKLKVKDILVTKLISAPQAEKLLGKHHPIMTEQVEKPPGNPTIVPATDKRLPLTQTEVLAFEDLTT